LGNGNNANQDTFLPINSETNWSKISSSKGYKHAIALKSDGSLKTWGNNEYGQLGDGTINNRNIPYSLTCPTLQTNEYVVTNLILYPNPVENLLFIDNGNNNRIEYVKIINLYGKILFTEKEVKNFIDLSSLKTGIYILEIKTENNNINTHKLIKK
jgi:alpha-tubulin suppressor-like RCC1 family protein